MSNKSHIAEGPRLTEEQLKARQKEASAALAEDTKKLIQAIKEGLFERHPRPSHQPDTTIRHSFRYK